MALILGFLVSTIPEMPPDTPLMKQSWVFIITTAAKETPPWPRVSDVLIRRRQDRMCVRLWGLLCNQQSRDQWQWRDSRLGGFIEQFSHLYCLQNHTAYKTWPLEWLHCIYLDALSFSLTRNKAYLVSSHGCSIRFSLCYLSSLAPRKTVFAFRTEGYYGKCFISRTSDI